MSLSTSLAWTIRTAAIADAQNLALIGAATFLETFAGVLDGQAIVAQCAREHSAAAYEMLLAAGAQAWLAEVGPGGAPVGFALISKPDLPTMHIDDIELKRIYVLSRMHGLGVGAGLMSRAIDTASRVGAKRLLLGVYAGNARALAFYRKNGFEPVAERQFNVGGKLYDDVVLARATATPSF